MCNRPPPVTVCDDATVSRKAYICHLSFVCYLTFVFCLLFAICYLLSASSHLPFVRSAASLPSCVATGARSLGHSSNSMRLASLIAGLAIPSTNVDAGWA